MKKLISLLIAIVMIVLCLASCNTPKDNNNKLKVVVTIFPIYDWVKNIVGDDIDNVDITMLLDNGADLHNYQATVEDIFKIGDCDLFIYVGGESDGWVDKALQTRNNPNRIEINLMDVLGDKVKEEEHIEGMEEHEHEHEHEEHEDHDEDEEIEYDEHVWLSLNNACVVLKEITKALNTLNSEKSNMYNANMESYTKKLTDLNENFKGTIKDKKTDYVVFADRFPFRYLFDDYNLKYYAAFAGCSAETEASFETIVFLANKVDELELKYIMTIENSNGKIAETVKNTTKSKDQTILQLDSLQSTTKLDLENGKTYYDTMVKNLQILSQVLN